MFLGNKNISKLVCNLVVAETIIFLPVSTKMGAEVASEEGSEAFSVMEVRNQLVCKESDRT